ncbi:MAG TPA: hypothetical protein VF631_05370 [Allosphingosinicella sp.]|jgi:hypothetical protein|uniref:hypothetical protein n=1 Tax=Allosphingosinicella sp. TaxID=2823234 RepID=UPI002F2936BF
MSSDPEAQPEGLRARAERCRVFAREYASDVGASLSELATELDLKADRLEAQNGADARGPSVASATNDPDHS